MSNCMPPSLQVDYHWWPWPWPLTMTFKNLLAMPTHMLNICAKFNWNPSTTSRDIAKSMYVNGQTDNKRTVGRTAEKHMPVAYCWRMYNETRDDIILGILMGLMGMGNRLASFMGMGIGMGTAWWEWGRMKTPNFPSYHPQVAEHQTLLMDPCFA